MLTAHKFTRNCGWAILTSFAKILMFMNFRLSFLRFENDTGSLNHSLTHVFLLIIHLSPVCFGQFVSPVFPLHYHCGNRLDVKDERHHLGTREGNHLHSGQGHVHVSMRSQLCSKSHQNIICKNKQ